MLDKGLLYLSNIMFNFLLFHVIIAINYWTFVLLKLEKKNHVTNNIQTENSSLCLIKHHAMKIHGEVQVQPHTLWTLALGECRQFISDASSCILWWRAPSKQWTKGYKFNLQSQHGSELKSPSLAGNAAALVQLVTYTLLTQISTAPQRTDCVAQCSQT